MIATTTSAALLLGALLVVARTGDALIGRSIATGLPPAGLRNDGNYCFANAIIQNLFHLPSIMEATITDGGIDAEAEERFATAAVFARLFTTEQGIVRPGEDFLPAFRQSVRRHDIPLEPGNPDDAEVFYAWMVNHALPERAQQQVKTHMELVKYFRGIPYRRDVEEELVARVHLSDAGEHQLEELLAGLHAQSIEDVSIGRTGLPETDQRLQAAGVVFDRPVNVVDETYAVGEAGPILPVFVVKDWLQARSGRLVYKERMHVQGTEYVLNGLALHSPGHYYGKVRQLGGPTWWTLDDAAVSPTDLRDVLGQGERVAMLFYVQAELHQGWIYAGGILDIRISELVREHNRRLAKRMMRRERRRPGRRHRRGRHSQRASVYGARRNRATHLRLTTVPHGGQHAGLYSAPGNRRMSYNIGSLLLPAESHSE